jgi:hypothetical protein
MDSDSDESSDESSESDSEDNSSEESDNTSDSEVEHSKSSHKKKSQKKTRSSKDSSSKEDQIKKHTSKDTSYINQKKPQEELIRQLGKMSVSDSQYALSYYKAVKLDALAAKCLHSPQIGGYSPLSGGNRNSSYPNNIPLGGCNSLLCYGCGGSGHGLRDCPAIKGWSNHKRCRWEDQEERWSTYIQAEKRINIGQNT